MNFEDIAGRLEKRRQETNSLLENLGKRKLELNQEAVLPFVECFSKIKNVEFSEAGVNELMAPGSEAEFMALKNSALKISSIAQKATTASAGGVFSSFGALSATSGQMPATNNTLAWFRIGDSGGTEILGGLVIPGGPSIPGGPGFPGWLGFPGWPVLSEIPLLFPIWKLPKILKAKKAADEEALLNWRKALAPVMKMAESKTMAIYDRSESLYNIIPEVRTALTEATGNLGWLVEAENEYRQYSDHIKKAVCRGLALAKIAHNLTTVPVIDENGELTLSSWEVYIATRSYLEETGKAGG